MKITSKEFRAMYSGLNKIIPKKKSPCQSVKVTLHAQRMTVDASNGAESIHYRFGPVTEAGKVPEALYLQYNAFRDVNKALSGIDALMFGMENGLFIVDLVKRAETEKLKFAANGAPVNVPVFIESEGKSVDVNAVQNAYTKCLTSVTQDKTRQALTSVFYDSRRKQMVATDGKRLTMVECELPIDRDILFPQSKFLSSSLNESLHIHCDDRNIYLLAEKWQYSYKLQDTVYPDYTQVVPGSDSFKGFLQLEEADAELLPLLKQSKACYLFHKDAQIYVIAADKNDRLSYIKLSAKVQGTIPELVTVNPQYLVDALAVCDDSCRIHLSGHHDPFLVSGDKTQVVIMPQRNPDIKKVKTYMNGEKTMPKEDPPVVKIIDKKSPMEELLLIVDSIEEKHRQTKETLDHALRQVRESQSQNKMIVKLLRVYEKDVAKRLKDVKQAEELVARLQKLVA